MEPQGSLARSVLQLREVIYKTTYTKANSFSMPFGGTVARVLWCACVPRCQ